MGRKDRKRQIALSVDGTEREGIDISGFAAEMKQIVAARIAEKYAEDPDKFARLVEVGLVDQATIRDLPEGLDFAGAVKQCRERLTAMAAEEPSVLGRLEVRPLDVLCEAPPSDKESPTSQLAIVFPTLRGSRPSPAPRAISKRALCCVTTTRSSIP